MKTKLAVLAVLVVVAACDESAAVKENVSPDGAAPAPPPNPQITDGGLPDAFLPDGAPADCYTNPKTHFEIINACTNALHVTKNPKLPLLYPDGGLPPTN